MNLNPFGDPYATELNPFEDLDSEGNKFFSILLESLYSQILSVVMAGRLIK